MNMIIRKSTDEIIQETMFEIANMLSSKNEVLLRELSKVQLEEVYKSLTLRLNPETEPFKRLKRMKTRIMNAHDQINSEINPIK